MMLPARVPDFGRQGLPPLTEALKARRRRRNFSGFEVQNRQKSSNLVARASSDVVRTIAKCSPTLLFHHGLLLTRLLLLVLRPDQQARSSASGTHDVPRATRSSMPTRT